MILIAREFILTAYQIAGHGVAKKPLTISTLKDFFWEIKKLIESLVAHSSLARCLTLVKSVIH